MMLTEEQKEKYIMAEGGQCPHCGSNNLEYGFYNDFAEGSECPVSCNDCGERWYDIYYLVLMEISEESVA